MFHIRSFSAAKDASNGFVREQPQKPNSTQYDTALLLFMGVCEQAVRNTDVGIVNENDYEPDGIVYVFRNPALLGVNILQWTRAFGLV